MLDSFLCDIDCLLPMPLRELCLSPKHYDFIWYVSFCAFLSEWISVLARIISYFQVLEQVTCLQNPVLLDWLLVTTINDPACILLTCIPQIKEYYASYGALELIPSSSYCSRVGFMSVSEWHNGVAVGEVLDPTTVCLVIGLGLLLESIRCWWSFGGLLLYCPSVCLMVFMFIGSYLFWIIWMLVRLFYPIVS